MTEASLDRLIAQTDAVAAAIADGEWETATRLEAERRALLQRFLETEARRHGGLEHLRDPLTELHARGHRFVGEVDHHRRRVIREACTVRTGRDAVKEYESTLQRHAEHRRNP